MSVDGDDQKHTTVTHDATPLGDKPPVAVKDGWLACMRLSAGLKAARLCFIRYRHLFFSSGVQWFASEFSSKDESNYLATVFPM